jgi:hypothetical protein
VPHEEESRALVPLPTKAFDLYSRMGMHAADVANSLHASWQRPRRHNRRIERKVLWHVLDLGVTCDEAVTIPGTALLRELRPEAGTEERYEVGAAIHTVRHHMPFTPGEREMLQVVKTMDDFHFMSDGIKGLEPALVERWHLWVWANEQQRPQTNVRALGASAMLAEACYRLSELLPEFLGEETSSK